MSLDFVIPSVVAGRAVALCEGWKESLTIFSVTGLRSRGGGRDLSVRAGLAYSLEMTRVICTTAQPNRSPFCTTIANFAALAPSDLHPGNTTSLMAPSTAEAW